MSASSSASSFAFVPTPRPPRRSARNLKPQQEKEQQVVQPRLRQRQQHPSKTTSPTYSPSSSHILLFLLAFRLLNAFTLRTFFQPDEFFQSLEPAWEIAFGRNQGAWITWEWKHHLRSSLHPLLFAAIYSATDFLAQLLRISPTAHADLLVAAPKTAQAVVAALGDFYTWKLAGRIYGNQTREAWVGLALTVLSPWQWFCSTRTLSNCLETTITIVALDRWPWQWLSGAAHEGEPKKNTRRAAQRRNGVAEDLGWLTSLRQCLSLAAFACILRPTNILIWVTLAGVAWLRIGWEQRKILLREVLLCGSAILALSAVADRLFYGMWTFPPLNFLYFNVAQSLSVFYGMNDFHYYVSQGYPLLLTTALPFTVVGLYHGLARTRSSSTQLSSAIRAQLAMICLFMPFVLSLISHKEVRFIYPLLPCLHVLAAPTLVDYFLPAVSRSSRAYMPRRLTLVFLLLANVVIALYTTIYHASGAVGILSYLREQHQIHSLGESTTSAVTQTDATASQSGITAGFLMPCHSTPWRSHLVFPTIRAWALSCEPPVGLNDAQKAAYLDEADQFYENPSQFLQRNMAGGLRNVPRKPTYLSNRSPHNKPTTQDVKAQHEWPDYLMFFAQLEPTLRNLLGSSSYAECHRTWNTAWHDDWRRRGDIVVWCLDPTEQQSWQTQTKKQDQQTQSREHQFDRIIESIRKEAEALGRGTGNGKSSSWKWPPLTSSLPTLSGSRSRSWSWPWEKKKPMTFAGISIPNLSLKRKTTDSSFWRLSSSASSSSWNWPDIFGGKKKAKQTSERDLWS